MIKNEIAAVASGSVIPPPRLRRIKDYAVIKHALNDRKIKEILISLTDSGECLS